MIAYKGIAQARHADDLGWAELCFLANAVTSPVLSVTPESDEL
jgi:hypothetical protein